MTKSIFYDIAGLLSQQCVFNFVIGNRGGGKSFGGKKLCINRFKKDGSQFVWIRRYKTEIDTLSDFWADIKPFYPDDELTKEGDKLYINGELAGYLVALSTSMQLKSVAYPNVKTIIFDEFIIDKGRITYLKNEVHVFLELFETIARMRDNVTAIFLGNAISIVNPYFVYFKLKPNLNRRFTKIKGQICIEFYYNDDFIAKKKETRYGKVVQGTTYGDYNMYNKFLRDSDSFIANRPESANYKCYQFIIDGQKFSLWDDHKHGCYYIDNSYEPNFGLYRTYVSNPNDMDESDKSHILLKKNNELMKRIMKVIERGDLFFVDQNAKQKFFEILLTNY